MLPIPLEIKTLVVHELAHDQTALSAVSYVWPETIPYIRERRFRQLEFYGLDSLSRFLAVLAGAPAILDVIRSISFTAPLTFTATLCQYAKLITLVVMAPNLEELSMERADLDLTVPPSSHSNLKTFTTEKSHTSSLTILLSSFPHLITLNLRNLTIIDLHEIGRQIWGVSIFPSDLQPGHCVMWDTHHIEGPKQIPQVTSMSLHIESVSHLMFLNLLASPKTSFPKLEEITFGDHFLPMCRPQGLPALLDRYKDTLRILDLQGRSLNGQTPALALPSTLEHFKFAVSATTVLGSILETLSCSTSLRNVSIDFRGCDRRVLDTVALDKVLVGMGALEKLELKVSRSKSRISWVSDIHMVP